MKLKPYQGLGIGVYVLSMILSNPITMRMKSPQRLRSLRKVSYNPGAQCRELHLYLRGSREGCVVVQAQRPFGFAQTLHDSFVGALYVEDAFRKEFACEKARIGGPSSMELIEVVGWDVHRLCEEALIAILVPSINNPIWGLAGKSLMGSPTTASKLPP